MTRFLSVNQPSSPVPPRAEHLRKAESRGNALYRSARLPNTTTLLPHNPREVQAQSRILAEYTRIEALQLEKETLALKLQRIVTRHRERARDEWRRIVGEDAAKEWDAHQEGEEGIGGVAWALARVPPEGSVVGLVAQLMGKGGLASQVGTPGVEEKVAKSASFPRGFWKEVTDVF
jgi:hypothetical protein